MEKNVNVQGWPIASILTIVFVVLKLTGVITWSWWWVLSPLWISFVLVILLFLIGFWIFAIADRRRRGYKKFSRSRKRF